MKKSGQNLNDILTDEDDEVLEELSIILTKKGKIYFIVPETTPDGIETTAKLLAHLIINWSHNTAEKLKTLNGSSLVIPEFNVGIGGVK
jgi:hypothetical protein